MASITDDKNDNSRIRKRRRIVSGEESVEETETAFDGTVWIKSQEDCFAGRSPAHNIFKQQSGPTGYAKRNIMKGNVRSSFSLIIDNYTMEYLQACTEAEARRVSNTNWRTSTQELNAFIGLLYARGAYETRNLKLSYLWSQKWGPAFFSKTMPRNKFTEIMKFIRFDKKDQRSQRLKKDKFALISEVWNRFIANSQACYKPGVNITVDEQLFPTKARCRFTQYMPNKPDKFGIKFWLAVDVSSKYIVNGLPYLGKDEARDSSTPLGEYVVLKLLEPYTGHGRNITTDSFFASLSLASKLFAKKTTLVGTIRNNRRELPKIAREKKDKMQRFSTLLYRTQNCLLTIYKSKPNKKVILLSSMHNSAKIDKNAKCLPETVQYYNATKFGVDVADQMAKKYSVKGGSRRWPLHVFCNILDLGAINAWILYKECTGTNISRKDFLFQLAEELVCEYADARHNPSTTTKQLAASSTAAAHGSDNCKKRKRCQIGFCKGDNKTGDICDGCKKPVCRKCKQKQVNICKKCDE